MLMKGVALEHSVAVDTPFKGESLYSTLSALFPAVMAGKTVIAAVGGGGKTGTLFALAACLADAGLDVSLTTTTHIRDPRSERGRRFDEVVIDEELDFRLAEFLYLDREKSGGGA